MLCMQNITLVLLFVLSLGQGNAQVIRLENPSFEGEPRDATTPRAWHVCEEGSTPDILPGPWGVYLEASEGETYVGIITRGNGTWENLSQRLAEPLRQDFCYEFSIDLARSDTYVGYNSAIKLRVYGGKEKCQKDQLLGESRIVRNTEWETVDFKFKAEGDIRYLILEAYDVSAERAREGNLLIDNISVIRKCTGA